MWRVKKGLMEGQEHSSPVYDGRLGDLIHSLHWQTPSTYALSWTPGDGPPRLLYAAPTIPISVMKQGMLHTSRHHHYLLHIDPLFGSLLTFPCGSLGLLFKWLSWVSTSHDPITVPHILWVCRPKAACPGRESGITPRRSPNDHVYGLGILGDFINLCFKRYEAKWVVTSP